MKRINNFAKLFLALYLGSNILAVFFLFVFSSLNLFVPSPNPMLPNFPTGFYYLLILNAPILLLFRVVRVISELIPNMSIRIFVNIFIGLWAIFFGGYFQYLLGKLFGKFVSFSARNIKALLLVVLVFFLLFNIVGTFAEYFIYTLFGFLFKLLPLLY